MSIHSRSRAAYGRHTLDCATHIPGYGGLENRYPSLGGSRVRIPPPPLNQHKLSLRRNVVPRGKPRWLRGVTKLELASVALGVGRLRGQVWTLN